MGMGYHNWGDEPSGTTRLSIPGYVPLTPEQIAIRDKAMVIMYHRLINRRLKQ